MGITSLSLKCLKLLLPFIIDHVLHVFNHAITCYSVMWKSVIVRPVAKVASPSCPSDYYCVCFERLINGQVLAHVDRSGLLSVLQFWV
jgi:hypothetical protein